MKSTGRGPTRRAFCAGMGLGLVGAALLNGEANAEADVSGKVPLMPTGLLCELLASHEDVRITTPHPMFAWMVPDDGPNTVQTAYQIQVALMHSEKPDLWDSGRVASEACSGIAYAGKELESQREYTWRVRIWTRHKTSGFSEWNTFRTGDLTPLRVTARYPIVTSEIAPVRVARKGEGRYFVDFGRVAFGRLRLMLPVAVDKLQITVSLGEARLPDDQVDPHPGGTVRYAKREVLLTLGHAESVPEKVMPFRYVEIVGWPGALEAANIRQLAEHYPFDDSASSFHCSDPVLNDAWDLCKYTMKATSFLGVYIDGDRERKPYEADAYINQLGHYSVDREYTLARYTHGYLMAHPTWPTEWQPHSILMAWADYLYTGDAASLAYYYEDLKAHTLEALAREDGLISTQTGKVTPAFLSSLHLDRIQDVVDWPAGERDGYELRPFNTVVNAFHYIALCRMGQIATALGHTEDAAHYRQQAKKVYAAFQNAFFDPVRGMYRDGEGSDHASLHASMFPLAFDLVPRAHYSTVVPFIKSRGMACSVYGAQYLLEALYNAGEGDYALALLTAKNGRSWGHMLYEVGTTITLEAWDNKYKPNQDWNHAWGAAPANIIPRRLMGIQPLEPGFRRVEIRPQTGGLRQGSIKLPTIRGPIGAAFESTPGKAFALELTLPPNTTGKVYLPTYGKTKGEIVMDGKRHRASEQDGMLCVDEVNSGKHTFQLQNDI